MAFTLVPELFPTEKRGEVIGWIIAGMSGSYLIGAFTVPYLQGIGGWRVTFLGYMLPFSLIALLFATLFIPGKLLKGLSNDGLEFRKSYLEIFSNRSALFSLFGYLLAMVPWQAIMTFNSSFFREWFSLSIGEASILILFGASLYTFGSIVSGKFVNRIGKKPLTVISIIFAGFVIMGYSFLPGVWLCGGCLCFSCLLVGVMDTASTGLIIEQSPLYVGIMMSLHRAVTQIGFSVGSGLGGFMLLVYGYRSMFLGLGFLGLLSGMVFHFFTSDPTI
jgi:predicted MFS family arabinose efflux permease